MKQRRNLLERVASAADLNSELLPKLPLVELAGDRRVLIENHQAVTEYGVDEICVKVSYGHVCVRGTKLELARMTKEQLVITGCIESVFLRRRRQ